MSGLQTQREPGMPQALRAGSPQRSATSPQHRTRLVYIVSPGHSGSTLLAFLIGAHPSIATVGELKVVPGALADRDPCSCGARIDECAFWRSVLAGVARRGIDPHAPSFLTHARGGGWLDRLVAGQVRGRAAEALRSAALLMLPPARARLRRLLQCNAVLIDAILEQTQRRVLLDSSKDASRLRYLGDSGRFELRILHLVRDGRAVAWSLIRKGQTPQQAARDWLHEHQQADRLRERWPDAAQWMQVHYEQLCANPAPEMDRICDFVGVPRDADVLAFRSWDSHLLGNRMRLQRGQQIDLDESWKAGLCGDALRQVEQLTLPLNRQFGYA